VDEPAGGDRSLQELGEIRMRKALSFLLLLMCLFARYNQKLWTEKIKEHILREKINQIYYRIGGYAYEEDYTRNTVLYRSRTLVSTGTDSTRGSETDSATSIGK